MNDLTYLPTGKNNYLARSNGSEPPDFEAIENVKHASTEGFYDAVFQNAFHAVYIENGDGLILKFNEKFCKLFGYTVSEMREVENVDLFEIDEDSFLHFINQRTDKGIAKGEITGIKKNGKRFPCRISSVIYQSDLGDKRAMNTLVDISEDLSARWNF